MHYSLNELGHEGNAALLKLLQIPFPNQLKSLCLSNLKTTGKAVKVLPEDPTMAAIGAEESKVVAVEEFTENFLLSNKPSIIHELTKSICHTESLLMLILTDMPLGMKA